MLLHAAIHWHYNGSFNATTTTSQCHYTNTNNNNNNNRDTMSLCQHLSCLVRDGLGFGVNDGHLFGGYLSFLGCKCV